MKKMIQTLLNAKFAKKHFKQNQFLDILHNQSNANCSTLKMT